MAFSFPSLPKLPLQVGGMSVAPAAVLNVVSLVAKNLPNINPPKPIYAILNAETGVPLTIPHSWGDLIFRKDWQVADYPIEAGGYAAYHKVQRPGQFEMTLIQTGSDLARFTWLEAIRQQIKANPIARYHIVTPQGVYMSYTISRTSYQTRPDRGSNLLYLDLQFSEAQQIEAPAALGDRTKAAESGPLAKLGRVFSTPTASAVAAVATVGAGLRIPGI